MSRRPGPGSVPALCLLLLLASRPAGADPETCVELDGPAAVHGLLVEDVDGDGTHDVLLLGGRTVRVFCGRKGRLPASEATWKVDLPEDVSFVDALPPGPDGEALVVLGTRGTRRVALADGAETPIEGVEAALDWTDWRRANFADLAREDGSLLVPTPEGIRWHGPHGRTADFEILRFEQVEPAGDFLEDTAVVTHAWPRVWVGPAGPEGAPPALWALEGTSLTGALGRNHVRYAVAFLPREGTRRLVDFTADGVPDLVHEEGTNQERTYAFFPTPPPKDGRAGGDLCPPAAVLRLSGYCLDPTFVDLDGDGRLDLVVTALPIDARNTMRALGGKVTAGTKAFLNRGPTARRPFPAIPDAAVASDVGIEIRFLPAGTLEIRRSLTILVTGDYDGDGRKDLAIRTAPGVLTVRRGIEGDGVWAAEGREVAIPEVGGSPDVEGRPADVTGDGRDEIVLFSRGPHGVRDRVWVVRP